MFAFEVDGVVKVASANADAFFNGDFPFAVAVEHALALFKDPRVPDGSPADEDAVDAILLLSLHRLLRSDDVAVAEDGYVHSRIGFYLADECPVGSAAVHLCLGAAVDAEGCDADILKLFGNF